VSLYYTDTSAVAIDDEIVDLAVSEPDPRAPA
jgi:hypothetical protein